MSFLSSFSVNNLKKSVYLVHLKNGDKQEGKKGGDFTVIRSFRDVSGVPLIDELLFWIIL